ncbi:hypothetical protein PPSIR1_05916 [Plesiocystis pacifica SIR-1]|uniref:Uncharacterized protein n=1 Tax=Plesiocystis pacifica SIR-1 TaxID=391625 RepID=A6G6Q8_9BACT|nr:hypothetical protein [Plesiocystis pacifica]EDM78361.1 hypothetical protein PPSIR1_05916 [Plesiocystis pacifica SIR-1]
MSTTLLDPLVAETERHVLVCALRKHPSWTLGELVDYVVQGGERAQTLRAVRLEELIGGEQEVVVVGRRAHSKGLVLERLEAARQATGELFDEFVREVLDEAMSDPDVDQGWIDGRFLRNQVGGPRWKLQASLTRLVNAGQVERKGRTNSTRYRRRRP